MNWQRAEKDELISPPPPRKGKGRIRLVLALAALGGLGWFLLTRWDKPAPTAPPAQASVREASNQAAILPIVRGQAEPSVPHGATPDQPTRSDGDQAREIIAELNKAAPELRTNRAYAHAEAFQDTGRLADAYLLYFYAARQGDPSSALVLGSMADPALYNAKSSFLDAPDKGQAYKWYRVAADRGNATAVERLAALRKRVEADAVTGDEQARRLLLQWR